MPKRKADPASSIDIPKSHPLHPCEAKRTSQLSQEVLEVAQKIANQVCQLTSSPAVCPVCITVHKLVTKYSISQESDLLCHFETADSFTDWLRSIDEVSSQFKTLKPAFQKYLSQFGMNQVKVRRTFLETRNLAEAHKELIIKLAQSDEQRHQTAWLNITTIADFKSESSLKSIPAREVYTKFGQVADQILKKTAVSMTVICKSLLEIGIGLPEDALLSGVQPVGVLTDAQNVLQKNYKNVMKECPVAKDRGYLATHDAHNTFIHLLVRNPNLQSEEDIAEFGFMVTRGRQRDTSKEVVQTIWNAYRKKCNKPLITDAIDKVDPRILISYQRNALAQIRNIDATVANWCESLMLRQRQRWLAAKLAYSTIDVYSRYTTQMLLYWTVYCGMKTCTEIGDNPTTLGAHIVDHLHNAFQRSKFKIDEGVRRCVAALQHILGLEIYPFSGKLDAREVMTEFRDRYPDLVDEMATGGMDEWTNVEKDLDHQGKPRDYFEEIELDALKTHIESLKDTRQMLAFILLKNTGLRSNAIRTLRTDSLWNSTLNCPLEYGTAHEKGGYVRMFAIQRDPELKAIIIEHLNSNPILCEKNGFMFPSFAGNIAKPMAKGTLGKWVNMWCRSSDIVGHHTHPHSFRKSLIIRLHRLGNSIERIARFVGHQNPKMTFNYYFTPSVELLTSDMQIPWLKQASNQVTLADISTTNKDRQTHIPSSTGSSSSQNYFQDFVEKNYWPVMKKMNLMNAKHNAAEQFILKFCTEEQIQNYKKEMETCEKEAQRAYENMTLDTLMEEDEDDFDRVDEEDIM